MEVEQSKHAATLTKKSDNLERERERAHFEILGLTKICLFSNGFVWSVLLHHQKQISYICTEVMRHHTESEWFWTGTEIAHVFFGGCQTMKTYEVMLKMQGKCHMQSNTQQVRHCPFCEKMFESSYYLDFHIARRHPKTQEIIMEDKLLEVVSKAEEATAARLKAETAIAMQTEIQQLREKSQVDLQRAEMSANAQVKTLQAELRQSNVQLQELQSCLQLLQSQFLSAPQPKATRYVQYTSDLVKEKDSGPEQERLYELETKFTALECQVKSLGQENLRLLKELDTAYNEVSDLRSGKEHSLAKLEIRVGELRMENQHLKKTMHKMEGEQFEMILKGKHEGGMSAEKRSRTPDTDQALLALARPISGRQRQELFMERLEKTRSPDSSPEKEKHRHSSSPAKQVSRAAAHLEQAYETSLDRKGLRSNPLQEKSRHSQESQSWVKNCRQPQNAEELKAQLEEDMLTAHAEEERRKKAVQRLLLKEKGKDRAHDSNTRKVQRRQDKDDGLHSYTHRTKSEAHGGSIVPLLLGLFKKEVTKQPKHTVVSAIHELRKIRSSQESNSNQLSQWQPPHSTFKNSKIPPWKSFPKSPANTKCIPQYVGSSSSSKLLPSSASSSSSSKSGLNIGFPQEGNVMLSAPEMESKFQSALDSEKKLGTLIPHQVHMKKKKKILQPENHSKTQELRPWKPNPYQKEKKEKEKLKLSVTPKKPSVDKSNKNSSTPGQVQNSSNLEAKGLQVYI